MGMRKDVSQVRGIPCAWMTKQTALSMFEFARTFFLGVIDWVVEQLWWVPRYYTCEIRRHTLEHRSQYWCVSLSAVSCMAQQNVKFLGQILSFQKVLKPSTCIARNLWFLHWMYLLKEVKIAPNLRGLLFFQKRKKNLRTAMTNQDLGPETWDQHGEGRAGVTFTIPSWSFLFAANTLSA